MARNGRGVFLSDGSNFEGEYLHISAFLAAFRCRRRLKRFGLLELEGDINTKNSSEPKYKSEGSTVVSSICFLIRRLVFSKNGEKVELKTLLRAGRTALISSLPIILKLLKLIVRRFALTAGSQIPQFHYQPRIRRSKNRGQSKADSPAITENIWIIKTCQRN
jgi:hypothetical protein